MMQTKNRLWWLVGLTAVVALGVMVQLWAASQWAGNFDSDEAIFSLMARHILSGAPPPVYMYGNSYLGAGESWLAAWLVGSFSFIEPTVFGLRLGNVMLFALFLMIHGWLVHYLWKWEIALVSLLLSAVPGALVLWWLYRPIGAFGLLLVCGTAALALSLPKIENTFLNYVRVFAVGVLLGLGFWSHQLTVVYAAVIFLLWLLQSAEWRRIYVKVPTLVWPFVTGLLTVLVIIAFFTTGCQLLNQQFDWTTIARLALLAIVGWTGVGFLWVSDREAFLQWGGGIFVLGGLIGSAPQWLSFLLGGIGSEAALVPSCPTEVPERGYLLMTEILPHLWGASWFVRDGIGAPIYEWLISAVAMPLIVIATLFFVWYWRHILGAIVSLRPLVKDDLKIVLVGLLFSLPIVLALLGGNTVDVLSTRYLLMTWQAGTIVLGWFAVHVSRETDISWSGVGLTAVLLLQIGVGYVALGERWDARRFEPTAVAQLEQFMVDNSVYGGYADYWDTYALNFLMSERVILTPITGLERYQRYNNIVTDMPTNAYVFPRDYIEAGDVDIDVLIAELNSDNLPAGMPYTQVVSSLQDKQVIQREQVAYWDVWIVR